MNTQRQGVFAIIWSSVGTIIMFAANALSLIILSRLIPPKEFGIITVATAIGMIIKGLGSFAVTQAMIQDGDKPRMLQAGVNAAWLVSVSAGLLLLLITQPLASILGFETDAWVLRAWVPVILLQGMSAPAQAVMQRSLRFKELTAIQATASIVGSAIVPIVLALRGYGLVALYAAVLGQAILEFLGNCIAVRSIMHPGRAGATWRVLRHSTSFSLIFASSAAANQGDNLVVGGFLGNEPLAHYSRAYRLMALPANMFGDAVDAVLFPMILRSREDHKSIEKGLLIANRLLAAILLPVSAVAVVLAEPFILIVLGPRWGGAVAPFRVLCVGMFFRVSQKLFASTLRGLGHQRYLAGIMTLFSLSVVGLALAGVPFGTTGVAAGVVTALLISYTTLCLSAMKKLTGSPWPILVSISLATPVALVSAGLAAAGDFAVYQEGATLRLLVGSALGSVPIILSWLLPPNRRTIRAFLDLL